MGLTSARFQPLGFGGPHFVPLVYKHVCFFGVPPEFQKMFCLGYEKRGFRSSVGPHGNQLSFFHKYEEKFWFHMLMHVQHV